MSDSASVLYTIRAFQFPQDYPAVIALWESAGPGVHVRRSITPPSREEAAARPGFIPGGRARGTHHWHGVGGFDGRRGMIYHLAVVPEYRQLGWARPYTLKYSISSR